MSGAWRWLALWLAGLACVACERAPERKYALDPALGPRFERLDRSAAALQKRGRGPMFEELLPLVEAAPLAAPPPQLPWSLALRIDTAQTLAALGIGAAEIARQRRHGLDPVASALTTKTHSFEHPVQVEDWVLLADAVALVEGLPPDAGRQPADGFYSSQRYRVLQWFKTPAPMATTIVLRQISGPRPDGTTVSVSHEADATPGVVYLLIGSHQLYAHNAIEAGGKPLAAGGQLPVHLIGPLYRVEGPRLFGLGQAMERRIENRAAFERRILGVALATASPTPAGTPGRYRGTPRWIKVPATISVHERPTADVVAIAGPARVGQPLRVGITSFGGGCTRAGSALLRMHGNTARIQVHDYTLAGKDITCTTELSFLRRDIDVAFPQRGPGRIEVSGHRVGTDIRSREGVPVTIARDIVVE